MNAQALVSPRDYDRHRFTVDEVMRMAEVGILDPDARTELIDGELIDMPSEGELHVNYKIELNRWFARVLDESMRLAPDSTMHLSERDAPEPDLYIFEGSAALKPIDPARVRLVIEIADSSLARDLKLKASLYARYGLAEYWVLDVEARVTQVHRKPDAGVYTSIARVAFDADLAAERLPDLPPLRIAGLPYVGVG